MTPSPGQLKPVVRRSTGGLLVTLSLIVGCASPPSRPVDAERRPAATPRATPPAPSSAAVPPAGRPAAPAASSPTESVTPAAVSSARTDHAADRRAILALAGRFTLSSHSDPGDTAADSPNQQTPAGDELFRSRVVVWPLVVEDRRIVLQHFLLFGQTPLVVKYYREDWELEPASLLTVEPGEGLPTVGQRRWSAALPPGTWSRTLYAADDAPAYAAWGKWEHDGPGASWRAQRPVWGQVPEGHLDASTPTPGPALLLDELRVEFNNDDATGGVVRHRLSASSSGGGAVPDAAATRPGQSTLHRYVPDGRVGPDVPDPAVAAMWEPAAAYWQQVRGWWRQRLSTGDRLRVRGRADAGARWKVVLDAVQAAQQLRAEPEGFARSLDPLLAPYVEPVR